MKAITYHKYGPVDVLKLDEITKPTPGDDEVLVEVHASAVNFGNLALVKGEPFIARFWSGLWAPKDKIPGGDVAGRVEAVGKNVTQFKPGDEIYGDISDCGFGAFAEFVSAPAKAFALKPANMTFDEAAAVPQAALVALQGLRNEGQIQSGQKVLINGASSGNGTYAVQLAKAFGCQVTGVCSTKNLELVHSIGADHVIDYTREDFTQTSQQYDLILAAMGDRSIFDYKRALAPQGTYVMTGGSMKQIMQANIIGSFLSKKNSQTFKSLYHRPSQDDLVYMKELIEAGKVKSVIDRKFPLAEAAEAFRYYEKGHSRGKVVISIKNNK